MTTDPGSLMLQAGRPVFVASSNQEDFRINKVLVGWKDTREARRAIINAMPFLQIAQEVRVISIDSDATDETRNGLDGVFAFGRRDAWGSDEYLAPAAKAGSGSGYSAVLPPWLLENDRLNRVMSN